MQVRVGGVGGFEANLTGTLDVPGQSATLTIAHGGGTWQPFENLLPGFYAPAFTGTCRLARAPRMDVTIEFVADDTVQLATTPVALQLTNATADTVGPSATLRFLQPTADASVDLGGFFQGEVAISLEDGAAEKAYAVVADMVPAGIQTEGNYTAGDIRPLAPFLPSGWGEVIVVHATEAHPLQMSLTVTPAAISLALGGKLSVSLADPLSIVVPHVPFAAVGTLTPSGLAATFTAPIPPITFPEPIGTVPGVVLALSSVSARRRLQSVSSGGAVSTLVTLPGLNRDVAISPGLGLHFDAPTPLNGTCDRAMAFSVTTPSATAMQLTGVCDGFEMTVLDRYTAASGDSLLPTINFLRLNTISIEAGIVSGAMTLSLGATLAIETGAPGNNACTGSVTAECLRAVVTASASVVAGGVALGFTISTIGAWLEPFGLRNFAVVDPALGLGVLLQGPTAVPKLVSWNLLLLHKPTGAWPSGLTNLDSWGTGCATNAASCTTPSFTPEANLVSLTSSFLFEKAPHDDTVLSAAGLPKFGCKLVVPSASLAGAVAMAGDILQSILAARTGATPSVPVGALVSYVDALLPITFSLDVELSLIQTSTFTRGVHLSLVANAQSLYGFEANVSCVAAFAPPPFSASSISEFMNDPLSVISHVGVLISAELVLPFGLGRTAFLGNVSGTSFNLAASTVLAVGPFSVQSYISISYAAGAAQLGLAGSVNLGPFGTVAVAGTISSSPQIAYDLSGSMCVGLLGFQMSGSLAASSATGSFALSLTTTLGFLGSLSFSGAYSGSTLLIEATISVSLSAAVADLKAAIISVISGGLTIISDPVTALIDGATLPFDIQSGLVRIKTTGGSLDEFVAALDVVILGSTHTLNLPLPTASGRRLLDEYHGRELQSGGCDTSNTLTVSELVSAVSSLGADAVAAMTGILPITYSGSLSWGGDICSYAGGVCCNDICTNVPGTCDGGCTNSCDGPCSGGNSCDGPCSDTFALSCDDSCVFGGLGRRLEVEEQEVEEPMSATTSMDVLEAGATSAPERTGDTGWARRLEDAQRGWQRSKGERERKFGHLSLLSGMAKMADDDAKEEAQTGQTKADLFGRRLLCDHGCDLNCAPPLSSQQCRPLPGLSQWLCLTSVCVSRSDGLTWSTLAHGAGNTNCDLNCAPPPAAQLQPFASRVCVFRADGMYIGRFSCGAGNSACDANCNTGCTETCVPDPTSCSWTTSPSTHTGSCTTVPQVCAGSSAVSIAVSASIAIYSPSNFSFDLSATLNFSPAGISNAVYTASFSQTPSSTPFVINICTAISSLGGAAISFAPSSDVIPAVATSFINDLTNSLNIASLLGSACEFDFTSAISSVG